MSKNHIMLDLETMGVGNNPALIQVAAIQFDINTGEEISKFDQKIDLQSSIDEGLIISASTIKFWMTHESVTQEARDIVMEQTTDDWGRNSLYGVLQDFFEWCCNIGDDVFVWGNGSASDNVWLRSAYDVTAGVECPFTFRQDMCLRTIRSIAKSRGYKTEFDFEGNQHDGLDDCRYQIKDLVEIKKFLNI